MKQNKNTNAYLEYTLRSAICLFVFIFIFSIYIDLHNGELSNIHLITPIYAFDDGDGGGNDNGPSSDAPDGGGGAGDSDDNDSNFGDGDGGGNDNPPSSSDFGDGDGGGNDNGDNTVLDSGDNSSSNDSGMSSPSPAPVTSPAPTPTDPEDPTPTDPDPDPVDPDPDPVPTTPTGGTGGVGGPGGLNAPSVTVNSIPGAGEQPLAFITLSQVPYTGFKAGTLTASLYWLTLIFWSGIIAYVLLTRKIGAKLFYAVRRPFRMDKKVSAVENREIDSIIQNQSQSKSENTEFPELPTMGYGNVSTDAIVLETDANGRSPRLELKRTGVSVQEKTKETVVPHQSQVATPVINRTSNSVSQSSQVSVVGIIRTVIQGDTSRLLEIIQGYKSTGKDMSNVLIQTLCELDRLYARRIGESESLKDESIEDVFENWKNKDIERLIHTLSTGIDQNYLTQHTSAKMAFLRSLEFAQEVRKAQ